MVASTISTDREDHAGAAAEAGEPVPLPGIVALDKPVWSLPT